MKKLIAKILIFRVVGLLITFGLAFFVPLERYGSVRHELAVSMMISGILSSGFITTLMNEDWKISKGFIYALILSSAIIGWYFQSHLITSVIFHLKISSILYLKGKRTNLFQVIEYILIPLCILLLMLSNYIILIIFLVTLLNLLIAIEKNSEEFIKGKFINNIITYFKSSGAQIASTIERQLLLIVSPSFLSLSATGSIGLYTSLTNSINFIPNQYIYNKTYRRDPIEISKEHRKIRLIVIFVHLLVFSLISIYLGKLELSILFILSMTLLMLSFPPFGFIFSRLNNREKLNKIKIGSLIIILIIFLITKELENFFLFICLWFVINLISKIILIKELKTFLNDYKS